MLRSVLALALLLVVLASPAAGAQSGNGMIAFASWRTYGDGRVDRGGIYVAAPDGSRRALLTPDVVSAEQPAWSPDGSRLAYLVDENHDSPPSGALWVVNADGSGRARIFAGEAGGHVWSPDGARIAFHAAGNVHIARVADSQVTNVGAGGSPSWSPDGTELVFGSSEGFAIVDAATGTRVRNLAVGAVRSPGWSPDGTRIAFIQPVTGPPLFAADLSVIRPDGSGRTTIWERLYAPSKPIWSPDGSRILLDDPGGLSFSGSVTFLHPREVKIARADGSNKTSFTRGRGGFSPAWSPDGTKVAFTTERGTSTQIFVANADGTCPTQLTRSAPSRVIDHAYTPSWQPVPDAPTSPPIRCADLGLAPSTRTGVDALRSVKEFRFRLGNEGNEAASGIRYVIDFPRTLVGQGISDSTCRIERRKITCEHPRTDVGVTTTIGVFARLVRPGKGAIRVTVEGAQFDGDRSNNQIRFVHVVSRCTRLGADRSDTLVGTARQDVICGNGGADRLLGRAGADELLAGAGGDTVLPGPGRDFVSAGGGADFVLARDGVRDSIACGPGRDLVLADGRDFVARDCERVVRP